MALTCQLRGIPMTSLQQGYVSSRIFKGAPNTHVSILSLVDDCRVLAYDIVSDYIAFTCEEDNGLKDIDLEDSSEEEIEDILLTYITSRKDFINKG